MERKRLGFLVCCLGIASIFIFITALPACSPKTTTQGLVPFQGAVAGTWSGQMGDVKTVPASGNFSAMIDASGVLNGSISGNYSGTITGQVDSNGKLTGTANFILGTITYETNWQGKVKVTGISLSIKGNWKGKFKGSGTFSGTRDKEDPLPYFRKNEGGSNMTIDIKKILSDYILTVNSHHVSEILSFCTDDVFYENVARGSVYRGKEEFAAGLNASFTEIPDLKHELKSVFGVGDCAAMEYVILGTHANTIRSVPGIPATGKTLSVRGVSIFQLRGGKISRQSEYYNLATVLQQIGLMPGQPK